MQGMLEVVVLLLISMMNNIHWYKETTMDHNVRGCIPDPEVTEFDAIFLFTACLSSA